MHKETNKDLQVSNLTDLATIDNESSVTGSKSQQIMENW